MSLPVHLVPTLDGVAVGDVVTVEGDEAHHAVAVRRLRVGEDGGDPELQTTFELEVRPGTQSGADRILRGLGVPGLRGGRGDLVVTIIVETPTKLDPRQEELLRELAAIRDEEAPSGQVRPGQKGVFGRLRDAFNQH